MAHDPCAAEHNFLVSIPCRLPGTRFALIPACGFGRFPCRERASLLSRPTWLLAVGRNKGHGPFPAYSFSQSAIQYRLQSIAAARTHPSDRRLPDPLLPGTANAFSGILTTMDMSVSDSDLAALFAAMVILAAVPSVSVAVVSAQAATGGFVQGAMTAMGVVAGDLVFILLALFGLALLVEAMGEMFFLIRYLAAGYLLWLGLSLWRSSVRARAADAAGAASPWSGFMTGLLITLGDHKAVLFYLGFLPAFIELDSLTSVDVAAVALVTVLAVGGVKLAYAFAAARADRQLGGGRAGSLVNRVAAGVMLTAAIVLLISAQ